MQAATTNTGEPNDYGQLLLLQKFLTPTVESSSISFATTAWTWWKGRRDQYTFTTVQR
jgi:hypothetical protein